jgi:hypothetical protein
MTPPDSDASRAAELAAAMAAAAARLPRDWPKELRPANPAAEQLNNKGELEDG